ncbi:MAG: Ig-like domain repeat protein, partial [Methanobrevibacter sp.]|nr:Ig-like domain repeat protein [Methanobrevibacter sp.]
IGFNTRIYTLTTDKYGYAKLQINTAKKGTYTISISFIGDDEYKGAFAVRKIIVNPQKPRLTLYKKTYRLKNRNKYLVATLKTAKGHAIAGKKISFRINGKTYTAKTNYKGIAKVRVSLSRKRIYAFTATFAGDNTFAKISKKSTLVVN